MMERPEPLHGEYRLGGDPCYRCLKRENEALRAAIARVRELCDRADSSGGAWRGQVVRTDLVRQALEGDSDD